MNHFGRDRHQTIVTRLLWPVVLPSGAMLSTM